MRKLNCEESRAASRMIMHNSTPATSASVRSALDQADNSQSSDIATVTISGYCGVSSYPKYFKTPSNGEVILKYPTELSLRCVVNRSDLERSVLRFANGQ